MEVINNLELKDITDIFKSKLYVSEENCYIDEIAKCFVYKKDPISNKNIISPNADKDILCTFVLGKDKKQINLKDIGEMNIEEFKKKLDALFIDFYKEIKTKKLFDILKEKKYLIDPKKDKKNNDEIIRIKAKTMIDRFTYKIDNYDNKTIFDSNSSISTNNYKSIDDLIIFVPTKKPIKFDMYYDNENNIGNGIEFKFDEYFDKTCNVASKEEGSLEEQIAGCLDEEFATYNSKNIISNILKAKHFLRNPDISDNEHKDNIDKMVKDMFEENERIDDRKVYLPMLNNFPIKTYFYDKNSRELIKKSINISIDDKIIKDEKDLSAMIDNEFINNHINEYQSLISSLKKDIFNVLNHINELKDPVASEERNRKNLEKKVDEIMDVVQYKKFDSKGEKIKIAKFKDKTIFLPIYFDDGEYEKIRLNLSKCDSSLYSHIKKHCNDVIDSLNNMRNNMLNVLNHIDELKDPDASKEENRKNLEKKVDEIIKKCKGSYIPSTDKHEFLSHPLTIDFDIYNRSNKPSKYEITIEIDKDDDIKLLNSLSQNDIASNEIEKVKDYFKKKVYMANLANEMFNMLTKFHIVDVDEQLLFDVIQKYFIVTKDENGNFINKYNMEEKQLGFWYYDINGQEREVAVNGKHKSFEEIGKDIGEIIEKDHLKGKEVFNILNNIDELKDPNVLEEENRKNLEKISMDILYKFYKCFRYNDSKNEFEIIPNVKSDVRTFNYFEDSNFVERFEINSFKIKSFEDFKKELNGAIKIMIQKHKFKNDVYKLLLPYEKQYLENLNEENDFKKKIENKIDEIYSKYAMYDEKNDRVYLNCNDYDMTKISLDINLGERIVINPFSRPNIFLTDNKGSYIFAKYKPILLYSPDKLKLQLVRQCNKLLLKTKLNEFFKNKSDFSELENKLKKMLFITSKKNNQLKNIKLDDYDIDIIDFKQNDFIGDKVYGNVFKVNLKHKQNSDDIISYNSYITVEDDSKNKPISIFVGSIDDESKKIGLSFDNNDKTYLKDDYSNNDQHCKNYNTYNMFVKINKIFDENNGTATKMSKFGTVHKFFSKMEGQHRRINKSREGLDNNNIIDSLFEH